MTYDRGDFAAWVKAQRQSRQLTQEALAEQVGCSRMTIAKIEAGERRPSAQMAALLATTLAIAPSEQAAFLRLARPPAPLEPSPHNLPCPLTQFVGRTDELAAIGRLLNQSRWLTVRGPGGIGKTRLALQAAYHLRARFPDGVIFVPLAAIRDPALVIPTLARTLGLAEPRTDRAVAELTAALQNKHLLLLLDNFEQVVPAAPAVAVLLAACPALRVLATSRAALQVQGEQQYVLGPLPVPDLTHPLSLAACGGPAVDLFVARAQALQAEFRLTEENAAAVAGICARLEGLPLAIELAAARSRLLSPAALLARLARRLDLLSHGAVDLPPRQQTLRGALAWSYDLLSPAEQRLFRRLAVFAGGGSLAAVTAVVGSCAAENELDCLAGLEVLLDQSLLTCDAGAAGEVRFGMLETIREYAWEQLVQSGEAARLQQAHADFFLALAERAAPGLIGTQQTTWIAQLEREHDNLRAAFDWWAGCAAGALPLLRLAIALGQFWARQGYWTEGRARLAAAQAGAVGAAGANGPRGQALHWLGLLAREQSDTVSARSSFEQSQGLAAAAGDPSGQANALRGLGIIARSQGDYVAAVAYGEQALRLYRELANPPGLARTLTNLGTALLCQGQQTQAQARLEEALQIWRTVGHQLGIASVLNCLGEVARAAGDLDRAARLYDESLLLARELAGKSLMADTLHNLGMLACAQGNYDRARPLFQEGLILSRELTYPPGLAMGLAGLAAVAGAQGQALYAARLCGAVAALLEIYGLSLEPVDRTAYERIQDAVRAQLDTGVFAAAWAAGHAESAEQVMQAALPPASG